MGKRKKPQSKFTIWLKNLQEKRRVVILDEGSFEEKRNFTTSKFSILVLFLFSLIVFSILFFLLISYSSIKTFVPGYPSASAQKELVDKNIELDQKLNELIVKTNKEERYINNIQKILNGDTPIDRESSAKVFKSQSIDTKNEVSTSEKTIREKVDKREKYDIDVIPGGALTKDVLPELLLFPPIIGELTNKMNISSGHFGVDIIAPKNEAVVAILKGTIVYQNWSPTDGHVVHVQHKNNLLSIYKHSSEVLKKIGDYVDAGEPISIVGNSGEHSTGPHLHFELWHNGYPMDPEKFINFQ
ncbi:MAG: M23 family metallopeptidase [Flavobacteriales bacterium]|jgi:murein DD-endopeptidase MepM/ murein hydrolase activator NlpD|tara:strand:- start:1726 stop:2625 length:900 start_codon:yes stop_codon:yes gene_type:complete